MLVQYGVGYSDLLKVHVTAKARSVAWKVCWRMTPVGLYRIQPFCNALAKGTQSRVLPTSTPSLRARVVASRENIDAKPRDKGSPVCSKLITYVRTVRMNMDIQNSVKNPCAK
jgi:hypothetical protein